MKKFDLTTLIVGILCLFGFIFLAIYSFQPNTIENPKKVVGVIYKESYATRGSDVYFLYYVSDKRFELIKPSQGCFVKGQKYHILCDSTNPSIANIILKEPLFTKDEYTKKTIARITDLTTEFFSKKADYVTFTYNINGVEYETYQFSDWDKYNVVIGETFELEYWIENPKRAIIHLDKKIK